MTRPIRLLRAVAVFSLLSSVFTPATASSQIVTRRQPESDEPHTGPWSTFVGGSLTFAQPQGEFKKYVSGAFGINGHLVHAFDPSGIVSFRAEVGYLIYGSETRRQALGGGALGLINMDVTTSNNILNGAVGLQLMAPTGALRPYVTGNVGLSYFFTQSSIAGQENYESFADTENFSDGGVTTNWGGGFYVPIKLRSGRPLSLDLGVQSHANADVQYLTKESIYIANSSAPPVITPVRSSANFLSFRIGVSVGVR
jgi:hypothetical protein